MSIPRTNVLVALCATFILLSTAGIAVAATNPSVEWSAAYGGSGDEGARSVEQTADGGYILFGTKELGNQVSAALLVKTDASGNWLWSATVDKGASNSASDVVPTADGGYAIIASSHTPGLPETSKNWLIKTDASGNEQWSKTLGDGRYDLVNHIIQVPDGGYVITGKVDSTSGTDHDVWLFKTDASGKQQWSRAFPTFGGGMFESVEALIRTADGGFALAGDTNTFGSNEGWLRKTDAGGNLTWAKTYDHPSPLVRGAFHFVEQTGDGGYILAGEQFHIGGIDADAWVVKTDASGKKQWSKVYGGVEDGYAGAVFALPGGGYLVGGVTWPQGQSGGDLWLFTLSPSGDQLWELVYGGGNAEFVWDGKRTADGGYVLAGLTGSFGAGGDDMWLVKIQPGGGCSGGGANTFSDVPANHPYHDAIEGMADAGVIDGYEDCSFGPGEYVLRQQFAKMIVGTLGFPCSEANVCTFADVGKGGPTTLYPDNYIAVAAQYGITLGIGGGNYGPYRNITRAQVITMVVRAAQQYTAGLQPPDASYAGWGLFYGFSHPDHGSNVRLAEFNGLLNGVQGSGDPIGWLWQPATRGEVAQILWNLLKTPGLAG
ncbi:MAG: S-layer homology domain-containing protein [bacterium]